jgi:carboxyl-terminal processing protease
LLAVSSPSDPAVRERLKVFSSVLRLIRDDYVDTVDTHQVILSSIEGMLNSLDPHSDFLDADTYSKMTEEHRGSFFGVGMTIAVQSEKLTVISPIEGTPAARAGILTGDYIVAIDSTRTAGITSDRAAELIRGPRGTKVFITVRREGLDGEMVFELTREEIPITSVPYACFLEPGVAYIRLARFAKNTADEMDQARERLLGERKIEAVILDLRGNSGGLLSSAVEVSDRFLSGGKLIVYTAGRIPRSNQKELAGDAPTWPEQPLVVLVDRGSASASEIVAGAVQDWDRGLVIGRTTFGKGLVQNVYELEGGNALKITTARYYTPSGRSIQREYNGTRFDYYRRAGQADGDSLGSVMLSHGGRRIRGGGGITPDVALPPPRRLARVEAEAQRRGIVFEEASRYLAVHPEVRGDFPSFDEFESGFVLDDGRGDSLRTALSRAGVTVEQAEWEEGKARLLSALRAEIAGHLWGPLERFRVLVRDDDDLAAALSHVSAARELLAGHGLPGRPDSVAWPGEHLDTPHAG